MKWVKNLVRDVVSITGLTSSTAESKAKKEQKRAKKEIELANEKERKRKQELQTEQQSRLKNARTGGSRSLLFEDDKRKTLG